MNTFLIVFQIVGNERILRMIENIKEYGIWARITDTAWCIKAPDKKTAEIRDSLNAKLALQNNERLMVVNITKSSWASYYLPKTVADWLKEEQ